MDIENSEAINEVKKRVHKWTYLVSYKNKEEAIKAIDPIYTYHYENNLRGGKKVYYVQMLC